MDASISYPSLKDQRGTVSRWRSVLLYVGVVVVALAPIAALGFFAYHVAATAVRVLVHSGNVSAAAITRELVEREFEHRIDALRAFAGDPDFIAAVGRRDEAAVRKQLAVLVRAYGRVIRAFVTDAEGTLWSDFPMAPESLGQNFAYRDWFKGLSSGWKPYVSNVYRRNASPQLLLVAIAAPVRQGAGGEVIGTVVYQINLESLSQLLRQVEIGHDGYVFLIDRAGNLAAHPGLDLQAAEYSEYAGLSRQAATNSLEADIFDYVDPFARTRMLAAALTIPGVGGNWTVIAQQPAEEALSPLRTLALQIGMAGVLSALLLTGLFFGIVGYHNRVKRLGVRLAELNRELSNEVEERQRAELALQQSNEMLEQRVEERTRELAEQREQLVQAQRMEAVGRLAGGVAHDFNNLLTVIVGCSDIILGRMPEDDPHRGRIEQVRRAGDRAGALTKQLLAFSRKQILQPELLDLNVVVEQTSSMLRRLIGEDIDFETKLEPGLDLVEFDPGQIEQIIMNLAVNARDAMPKGGKLTLQTENVELDESYVERHAGARAGPHVMIAMTDTGVGMDAATLERIFEPFFTTKDVGRGTGLGLSTVYGIVKQSGGNIWVYSEPGRGTTFKVYLPRAERQAAEVPAAAPAPEPPQGSETILVVEDEEDVRELLRDILELGGYTVLATDDPAQAMDICRNHDSEIHLVLSDVVMPKIDGPVLAEKLKDIRPGLKVAFMSGYTDDAIVHHGVLEPGTAFLEKPIDVKTLLRKVPEFLGRPTES